MKQQTVFRFPQDAFDDAIRAGRLSVDPAAPNFAGHYMYMGTVDGADTFKHIDTRRYLAPLATAISLAIAPTASWAHIVHELHAHTADGGLILFGIAFVITMLTVIKSIKS